MRFLLLFFAILHQLLAIAQTKIAVIGGGIAGVSCAHYLREFDSTASITIFEKENQLGGNAQSIMVKNAKGENTTVDIGPQYFTKGPWDAYIKFLNESIGWKNIRTEKVYTTLVMQKEGRVNPLVTSPLKTSLRGERLTNLLKLRRFNLEAYKVYKNPEKWKGKTANEWVQGLKFEESYKKEIIFPFLAASLGATVAEIKTLTVSDLVKLFAFRKPKISNNFEIMTDGMGQIIIEVGKKLAAKNVNISTASTVQSIKKVEAGYELTFAEGESIQKDPPVYDFVVLAVPSNVAAKVMGNDPALKTSSSILQGLSHFKMNIAIHSDSTFVQTTKPSFLNIFTSNYDEVSFHTMNLSLIAPRLNGLYKTWVSEEQKNTLKANGHLLAEAEFWVNMVTPQFMHAIDSLNEELGRINNLAVIGGWTGGLETQNSAVLSALSGLEKYKAFKK